MNEERLCKAPKKTYATLPRVDGEGKIVFRMRDEELRNY